VLEQVYNKNILEDDVIKTLEHLKAASVNVGVKKPAALIEQNKKPETEPAPTLEETNSIAKFRTKAKVTKDLKKAEEEIKKLAAPQVSPEMIEKIIKEATKEI